jgi:ArsR family transcriptional regulator, virulence genes transcriptional regulator
MKPLYQYHADFCKTIAQAKRLEILDNLRNRERSVTDLAELIGAQAANVSQQLAILRTAGAVATRREGTTIYYRIAHPKILQAYDLMTEVMEEMTAARMMGARTSRVRSTPAQRPTRSRGAGRRPHRRAR